jgi:hypothetical protein
MEDFDDDSTTFVLASMEEVAAAAPNLANEVKVFDLVEVECIDGFFQNGGLYRPQFPAPLPVDDV